MQVIYRLALQNISKAYIRCTRSQLTWMWFPTGNYSVKLISCFRTALEGLMYNWTGNMFIWMEEFRFLIKPASKCRGWAAREVNWNTYFALCVYIKLQFVFLTCKKKLIRNKLFAKCSIRNRRCRKCQVHTGWVIKHWDSPECCKGANWTPECLNKKIKNKIRTTTLILLKTLESLTFGLYIVPAFLF